MSLSKSGSGTVPHVISQCTYQFTLPKITHDSWNIGRRICSINTLGLRTSRSARQEEQQRPADSLDVDKNPLQVRGYQLRWQADRPTFAE